MHEVTTEYAGFIRGMWQENCIERDSFNEPQLSYQQYTEDNRSFLEEKFYTNFAANWFWDAEIMDYREGTQK